MIWFANTVLPWITIIIGVTTMVIVFCDVDLIDRVAKWLDRR